MTNVTQILTQIEAGNPQAAEQLLPLVYDELRKLAAMRLGQEKPGQTLQATALVHEAYVRLVDVEPGLHWNSRGHFFAAAAEAMRRILVDNARRKRSSKHGGTLNRQDVDALEIEFPGIPEDVVALDEALTRLATMDKTATELVHLSVLCRSAARGSSPTTWHFLADGGSSLGVCAGLAPPGDSRRFRESRRFLKFRGVIHPRISSL